MTDLEKWLEDIIKKLDKVGACKKKRLTPEEIRIRAELLRIDFPKALRIIEVAVDGLLNYMELENIREVLTKLNEIAKEKI